MLVLYSFHFESDIFQIYTEASGDLFLKFENGCRIRFLLGVISV